MHSLILKQTPPVRNWTHFVAIAVGPAAPTRLNFQAILEQNGLRLPLNFHAIVVLSVSVNFFEEAIISELQPCIKVEASAAVHHLNMPKDRRVNSFSFNRSRTNPYSSSSKNSDLDSPKSLPPAGNEREWEEARCPICMEHPHNAVLLLCSSRDKGCQPYMCNTSHRHSNCLDQFCKSSAVVAQQDEDNVSGAVFHRGSWGQALSGATRSHVQQQPELACPLCRGHVEGWVVIKPARNFMNSKTRSCALETCNFSGNYAELRKHARHEHPLERPSEADPMRKSEWTQLEVQRDSEDTFSAYQAPSDDDSSGDDFLTELSLDSGLFDLLDGYSKAEEGLDEDINISLDFELEVSFLSEFPLMPSAWDGFSSYAGERSTFRRESGARSPNRRSRRSTSDSDNSQRRPTGLRSTSLSSRRAHSSFEWTWF